MQPPTLHTCWLTTETQHTTGKQQQELSGLAAAAAGRTAQIASTCCLGMQLLLQDTSSSSTKWRRIALSCKQLSVQYPCACCLSYCCL